MHIEELVTKIQPLSGDIITGGVPCPAGEYDSPLCGDPGFIG